MFNINFGLPLTWQKTHCLMILSLVDIFCWLGSYVSAVSYQMKATYVCFEFNGLVIENGYSLLSSSAGKNIHVKFFFDEIPSSWFIVV